jgi:hypothetical protein
LIVIGYAMAAASSLVIDAYLLEDKARENVGYPPPERAFADGNIPQHTDTIRIIGLRGHLESVQGCSDGSVCTILADRVETPVAAQPAAILIRLDVLSEPGNSVCEDLSNA